MTNETAVALSAIAAAMALLALGLGVIVTLQAARIERLNRKLGDERERSGDLSQRLHQAASDLEDLRDENIKLLRSWVTGEAS